MIFVTNFLSLSPILDLCTLLTFPTFYLLVLDSFLRCNNPNNFCTTVTLIPHTYCATHSVFPLALPNFLVSTTITQRGHYCFLKICLFFFFPSYNPLGYILKSKMEWDLRFHLSITCSIGAGMDKEDIYQNKKHMRGGEDFSPIVSQTWIWLTLSQWNSHLSINQWKQKVCQSFTCVSFNTSGLLTCKLYLVPTKRILKEVLEITMLTYNSNGGDM